MCVCMRAFAHVCVQVTAFTSGPAQHHFDFPAEITSCTCSTWAHTHTHTRTLCLIVMGLFVSHIAQAACSSITAETKGKISVVSVWGKKMTIIDFFCLFSQPFSFLSVPTQLPFFLFPPFVYCVFLTAEIKCIIKPGKNRYHSVTIGTLHDKEYY